MVRKIEKSDIEEIISWFHSRNIAFTSEELPQLGYIVPGKAAGFMYQTDSNFVIFESFVGNTKCSRIDRQKALREIVTEMIKEAHNLGFKRAFGFVTSSTMLEIGYENGFQYVENCKTIVKDL